MCGREKSTAWGKDWGAFIFLTSSTYIHTQFPLNTLVPLVHFSTCLYLISLICLSLPHVYMSLSLFSFYLPKLSLETIIKPRKWRKFSEPQCLSAVLANCQIAPARTTRLSWTELKISVIGHLTKNIKKFEWDRWDVVIRVCSHFKSPSKHFLELSIRGGQLLKWRLLEKLLDRFFI
jgi:hypothetical protein